MAKWLREVTYQDIVGADRYQEYYEGHRGHVHVYRLDRRFPQTCYLRCQRCGHERMALNPKFVSWWAKQQENKKQATEDMRFDRIDREYMRRGFDNYEGDLKKALLQPYNSDGSLNYEFVKNYGMPNATISG